MMGTSENYPRIMVISNNSFSKTSSNGRTLGNLFLGWPKEKLAQFCISTTEPDFGLCDNYYLLTDRSVLNALKHLKKGPRCDIKECLGTEGNTVIGGKRTFKTPWKAMMRHLVWSGKRWNSKEFQKWVDGFGPELIMVMNSDATFILDIASYVSKNKRLPLVMYNTEGFYFFCHSYFNQSRYLNDTLFRLYQHIYKKHFRAMMKNVSLSFHLNSLLKDDFKKEFGGEHEVLYTGSSLRFDKSNLHIDAPVFSYLGNFGFNRPFALIQVAEVLQSISTSYKLDIYGKIPNKDIQEKFDNCPGINYKGMLPYEEVIKVMYESTILFHVEVQTQQFEESLHYGFSTKIADSVSSGHPFLMFSSPYIAGAKYIIDTGAGWHAKNLDELRYKITEILQNACARDKVLERAEMTARENHTIERNANKLKERLCSLVLNNK